MTDAQKRPVARFSLHPSTGVHNRCFLLLLLVPSHKKNTSPYAIFDFYLTRGCLTPGNTSVAELPCWSQATVDIVRSSGSGGSRSHAWLTLLTLLTPLGEVEELIHQRGGRNTPERGSKWRLDRISSPRERPVDATFNFIAHQLSALGRRDTKCKRTGLSIEKIPHLASDRAGVAFEKPTRLRYTLALFSSHSAFQ